MLITIDDVQFTWIWAEMQTSISKSNISLQPVLLRTRHPQALSSFLLQPGFLRCLFRICFDFSLVSLLEGHPTPVELPQSLR